MAWDGFLKIADIPGESTDDKHKDWIEILSYSHNLTQPVSGSMSTGGGVSTERVEHAPFTITKGLDKASPKIAEACCKGTHIGDIELSLNRAGGEKVEYMNYKFKNCMITSYTPGGSATGADAFPSEEVSWGYGKIEWTYTVQKMADGSGGGKVAAGWSVETNAPI